MAQDYKNSLNMPKTDFPMRGNLPKREPDLLGKWETERLYDLMMQKNAGKPSFMFHDGPPYANGTIHIGTALNKTLKDFIFKQKNMTGYYAPYVPGWDTHGLPIELKALKEIGVENGAIPPVELRKACKDFALTHVENQKKQFKRLGSIADYDHPYLTLRPEYEARQVEVFGKMAKDGYMYKGLKPVYWCPDCNTALAEAEIEYENDPCNSIYVKFKVTDDKGLFTQMGLNLDNVYFVIWTTTTWTIPGNLAICLGPEYNYTLVKVGEEYYVMADELVKTVMETAGIKDYSTDGIFTGAQNSKASRQSIRSMTDALPSLSATMSHWKAVPDAFILLRATVSKTMKSARIMMISALSSASIPRADRPPKQVNSRVWTQTKPTRKSQNAS